MSEENQLEASNSDILRDRVNDCQVVLNELEKSNAWKVVMSDASKWVKQLDDKWQDVSDEKQLKEMRIIKMAYKYLLELPNKYKRDLDNAQVELLKIENPDKYIQKYYDEETNVE